MNLTRTLLGSATLLFIASRFSDAVNAFVALWLVPRWVPQGDLGAVLPLAQAGAFVSLPVYVLMQPYTKLLAVHAVRGEWGKTRALLADAVRFALVALAITPLIAWIVLPRVLRSFHIENGNLALAMVVASVVIALAPVLTAVPQALRRFGTCALSAAAAGPARLVAMVALLPLRGLTGYFGGQLATPLAQGAISVVDLFRTPIRRVRRESYWREDRETFLRFGVALGILTIISSGANFAEMMLLSVLPTEESAAYYHITRWSEIATYVGASVTFVLFPWVAALHEQGRDTSRLLRNAMLATLFVSCGAALGIRVVGPHLLTALPASREFVSFSPLFLPLGFSASLRMTANCFTTRETACGRFRWVIWSGALAALEILILRVIHVSTLSQVVWVFFTFSALQLAGACVHMLLRKLRGAP